MSSSTSSTEFQKIVKDLQEKEELARIRCSATLNNLAKLTRETELLNLTLINKLLEMEQTPSRDAALKFYKSEQGADETMTWLLEKTDKHLKDLIWKSEMHFETLKHT